MNVFLSHLNWMPFIYGLVLALSVILLLRDFANGEIGRAIAVMAIMWLGFSMHGDASDTRMGVAIAAVVVHMCWNSLFSEKE